MPARLSALLLLAAVLLAAASNNVATARGENPDLSLKITLRIDAKAVKEVIGDDLSGQYIVAEVSVDPKTDNPVLIDWDDFLLRTDKDGEKARPYVPSQIAGRGALVIRSAPQGGGWGAGSAPYDYPGGYPPPVYTGGRPPRGVTNSAGVGAGASSASATVTPGSGSTPLEETLRAKELPRIKTSQPVSGLLYFLMEKQKIKDLELIYSSGEKRIALRFR